MYWDDLAAAIIGLESEDRAQLLRMQTICQQAWPGSAKVIQPLLETIQKTIGKLLSSQQSESEGLIKSLERQITQLQAQVSQTVLPKAEQPAAEVDLEILRDFITESIERIQSVESNLITLEKNPEDCEAINSVFRVFHSIKGMAIFLKLETITQLSHSAERWLEQAREGKVLLQGSSADLALAAADLLKTMILDFKPLAYGQAGWPHTPARFEKVLAQLNQPLAEGSLPTPASAEASTPGREQCREIASEESVRPVEVRRPALDLSDGTIRIQTKKMDQLMNMIGELVIIQAMIAEDEYLLSDKGRPLSRVVGQLGKISRNLQNLSLSIRMVPLKPLFQKIERMARDVARHSGKAIEFKLVGEETEIDRNMVEGLHDPLVHLIRNAVDHGIEPETERLAQHKPGQGSIVLRAFHAAGHVVLELRDDGQGLNREKIYQQAIKQKLISPEQSYSEREMQQLIFTPGFSTASTVTEVSGRGVGMDVVKKNIEAMQGRVEIATESGQGTTFIIRLPLTLAIIDGLMIKVGREEYLVPTLNVKHAFRPNREMLWSVQNRGELVRLRNELIPIFRLSRLFQLPQAEEDPTRGVLLVVEHEGRMCALLADSLLGKQQVVIKTLGEGMDQTPGIAGATIIGDGGIRLILDMAGIMRLAFLGAGNSVMQNTRN